MKEDICLHISFVILPLDEFTGKVIRTPDFLVWAEDAARPVRKPDGFWVFTGTFGEEICVTLQGAGYQKRNVWISRSGLNRCNPVVKVYVKPDRNYRFPACTIYIEGTLPEHAVLSAAGILSRRAGKLSCNCRPGDDTLVVYQEEAENIAGRRYLLTDRKGETEDEDWIALSSPVKVENGSYRLEAPVCYAHEKASASLFPAVCHEAGGQSGDFFLAAAAYKGMEQVFVHCRLQREDESQTHVFCIREGESLQWKFEGGDCVCRYV